MRNVATEQAFSIFGTVTHFMQILGHYKIVKSEKSAQNVTFASHFV